MEFKKNPSDYYNPMDAGTHARIDIAVLEIIDSLRSFITGEIGARRMSNDEFAMLLEVAANSARRVDQSTN